MSDKNKLNKEEINEEEITVEEMEDMVYSMIEERAAEMVKEIADLEIDLKNIKGNKLDAAEYKKGLKEVSRIAGMMAGLKAIGVDDRTASELIMAKVSIDFNEKSQETAIQHEEKMKKIQEENESL